MSVKLSDTDRWMILGYALTHYVRALGDITGNTTIKVIDAPEAQLTAADPSTFPPQQQTVTVRAEDRVGPYLVGYNYKINAVVVYKPEK